MMLKAVDISMFVFMLLRSCASFPEQWRVSNLNVELEHHGGSLETSNTEKNKGPCHGDQ